MPLPLDVPAKIVKSFFYLYFDDDVKPRGRKCLPQNPQNAELAYRRRIVVDLIFNNGIPCDTV